MDGVTLVPRAGLCTVPHRIQEAPASPLLWLAEALCPPLQVLTAAPSPASFGDWLRVCSVPSSRSLVKTSNGISSSNSPQGMLLVIGCWLGLPCLSQPFVPDSPAKLLPTLWLTCPNHTSPTRLLQEYAGGLC